MNSRNEFGARYIQHIEELFSKANEKSFGFLGILRYAVERFSALRGVEGSASIAFFTIFGLPPLLIVLVSVASYYLEIPDIQDQIIQFIREIIPIPPDLIIEFLEGVLNQRGAVGNRPPSIALSHLLPLRTFIQLHYKPFPTIVLIKHRGFL